MFPRIVGILFRYVFDWGIWHVSYQAYGCRGVGIFVWRYFSDRSFNLNVSPFRGFRERERVLILKQVYEGSNDFRVIKDERLIEFNEVERLP